MKNIFLKIIKGEAPADIVFEDEHTMAFLDIRPLFPGHTLLVPKAEIITMMGLPDELILPLFKNARLLSAAIKQAMSCEGIFMANNNIVSQSVAHLHIHLVPRNKKDGLKGFFWPRVGYKNDAHKKAVQQKIIEAINNRDNQTGKV